MEKKLTHFDTKGNAVMVDVGDKDVTTRTAVATGKIRVNEAVMKAVMAGTVKKGDVLGVARVAGIMAVKQTAGLIPMCHTLFISKCSIEFEINKEEMGVSVTLLTIYDMCKAIDKRMEMNEIHLETKSGGKSGDFAR